MHAHGYYNNTEHNAHANTPCEFLLPVVAIGDTTGDDSVTLDLSLVDSGTE